MSTTDDKVTTSDVKKAAKKVENSAIVQNLTRLGYGVRGLIYVVMGVLAVQLTLGKGGTLATPQEAIAKIGAQPAGKLALWVVLIGLISYALWGVIRAVMDPLHKGHDAKGLIERFGFLTSAFGYIILIIPTYGYIFGTSKASSGGGTQQFISKIMGMPWGRWVIALLGLGVLIGGLYQIYLGIRRGFENQFKTYALTSKELKVVTGMGRFGTAARGVVFAIVGGLIVYAAYRANPSQQVGMDTALATILRQPFGVWLLTIIALGLIAFGVYSMLGALWFRIKDN